jgi:hypothetical protein
MNQSPAQNKLAETVSERNRRGKKEDEEDESALRSWTRGRFVPAGIW